MSKKFTLEPRTENILGWQIIAFTVAMIGALLVTAGLLHTAGLDVLDAYRTLFEGALGGQEEILETLVRSVPLILTGMATVVAFGARIWSIGQEGQLVCGGVTAFVASVVFKGLPAFLLLPTVLLFGILGGALLGGFCGWLKSRFGVDEIISTVMLNYIVFYMLSYLLSGPIQDPNALNYYQQSAPVAEAAALPILIENTRFNAGFFLAVVVTIIIAFVIKKTPLGYDIRAFGYNPRACAFKGTNVPAMFLIVMCISGGCAGLAGAIETLGATGRVNLELSSGLGYTGILVALVGGLTPLGTLLAALLFGGLMNGGFIMQIMTSAPNSIITAMQGIVLIFVLMASLLTRFKIRRVEVSV